VSVAAAASETLLTRLAVEDFLYAEAALLDAWRLDDWLALFTEDCRYFIPATDLPDGDPRATLGLIDDDRARLQGRVDRLNSAKAYREFPWSRTTRLITNVRLPADAPDTAPGELAVAANCAAWRYRKGDEQTLVGALEYRLAPAADDAPAAFRIRSKRVVLTAEALRPHGTLSIIL
jgi:p-cumate 2,3-dioxygenase beta subunit